MALFVELGDELPQGLAQLHVYASRGFVQYDDGWLVHQGLGHKHPSLHAARELAHIGIGLVSEAQAFQQLVDPSLVVLHTKISRLDAQGLTHVEKRVKNKLLRHHAELTPCGGKVFLYIMPQHAGRALAWAGQAGEHADHGGLARAVRPQ